MNHLILSADRAEPADTFTTVLLSVVVVICENDSHTATSMLFFYQVEDLLGENMTKGTVQGVAIVKILTHFGHGKMEERGRLHVHYIKQWCLRKEEMYSIEGSF